MNTTKPYDTNHLLQRRREKLLMRRVGWIIVAAAVGIMFAMLLSPRPNEASAADTPPRAATCNERCQLNRKLTLACPQVSAMTRARCVEWVQVAQCETGGQQRRVTLASLRQIRWRYSGPGYYDGGLQFSPTTWASNVHRIAARHLTRQQRRDRAAGRYAYAYSAPSSVQILAAEVLRKRIGGNPQQTAGWPVCGGWWYG